MASIEQESTGRLATVRLERAVVAVTGHLIALKLLARNESRPQDLADLLALAKVATAEDWAVAREAVGLITERGYNPGRDLVGALAELTGK